MSLQNSERFVLAVVVLVFGLATSAVVEGDDIFAKVVMECKTAGMEEGHFDDIMEVSAPTEERKCFIACTMKKLGLLTEDNVLDTNAAVELRHKMHGVESDDVKDPLFIDALTSNCAGLKGENDCDTAFQIFKCGKVQHDSIYM